MAMAITDWLYFGLADGSHVLFFTSIVTVENVPLRQVKSITA